jgi:predicted PurR-regulated permease PerM
MGLMLGFVQWQSGMEAWGFWGAFLGFPGLAALYAISATGQRLSAHQMEELKGRIDTLVEGLEASEAPSN